LGKLKRQAFYRRAIYPLLHSSFDSSKHYAKDIGWSSQKGPVQRLTCTGYNLQDVDRILKKLGSDHLLAASRSKQFKGHIVLAKDMHDAANKTYFDPRYLIGNYVSDLGQDRLPEWHDDIGNDERCADCSI
jgi:hypothetical protein